MEHPPLQSVGAFIRRKDGCPQLSSKSPYWARDYEVMCVEAKRGKAKADRFLPFGPIKYGEDCAKSILNGVLNWTRALAAKQNPENLSPPGLLGRRAIYLGLFCNRQWVSPSVGSSSVLSGGPAPRQVQTNVLYLFPVTKGDSKFLDRLPESEHTPAFHCLHEQLRSCYRDPNTPYPVTDRAMLAAVDKYLREQHMLPDAIDALFLPSAQLRVRGLASNPLFAQMPDLHRSPDFDLEEVEAEDGRVLKRGNPYPTDEADVHIINPLMANQIKYFDKVERCVVNPYFGRGVPNYDKVCVPGQPYWHVDVEAMAEAATRVELDLNEEEEKQVQVVSWVDEYPLHCAAVNGNVAGILALIQQGLEVDKKDVDTWTAMHYACWNGQAAAVRVLLDAGSANPMIINESGSTALHFAAGNGRAEVTHMLLNHPDINVNVVDGEGRTARQLCEERKANEWEVVMMLLRGEQVDLGQAYKAAAAAIMASSDVAMVMKGQRYDAIAKQAIKKQRVNLMDSTHKIITLERGFNSTTQDMVDALAVLLGMEETSKRLFTIFVASPSLRIPLPAKQKPLEFVRNWPEMLIRFHKQLENSPPEVPAVYFQRDPLASKAEEENVDDPVALELLFHEARHHVVSGLYPCSEQDAINLAGAAMQIEYGDHNDILHRQGFLLDALGEFLPAAMLVGASRNRLKNLEQMILQTHRQVTARNLPDERAERLLYVDYCRRWPVYSSVFFDGTLVTESKGKQQPVRVAVSVPGFHLTRHPNNEFLGSFLFGSVEWSVDSGRRCLILEQTDGAISRGRGKLFVEINEAALVETLAKRMEEKQRQLIGAKGLLSRKVWDDQPPVSAQELSRWQTRFDQENFVRGQIVQTFGSTPSEQVGGCAHTLCQKYSQVEAESHLQSWSNLCLELGIFLDINDLTSMEAILGQQPVNFRSLVMWWSQSSRSWLFLLDDDAVRRRQRAVRMFCQFQVTPGNIPIAQVDGLLQHMCDTSGVHLPHKGDMQRCLRDLHSLANTSGQLLLNTYIDWLALTSCLPDKPWATHPPVVV